MDFFQLRALDGRATDAAIEFFVQSLNEFFEQLNANSPDEADQETFLEYMNAILEKINEVEVNYFSEKWVKEWGEDFPKEEIMRIAAANKITDYKKLPIRMQYWAAGEVWGGSIRNAEAHKIAIKGIEAWPKSATAPQRHFPFFRTHDAAAASAPEADLEQKNSLSFD